MDVLSANGYMYSVVLHKNSVVNRRRLKWAIFLHVVLLLTMLFRLSTSFFVLLSVRPPIFLQLLRLPRAWIWEYFWLLSGIASVFGIAALRKNRLILLNQFLISLVIFGIVPTIFGIFDLLDDLQKYFVSHKTNKTLFGLPVIVLWNMFLTVSLQVQAFALYFAWNLRKAWMARVELKKSK